MINLDFTPEGFDRITYGVYLNGANNLTKISEDWKIDYPICGDTLARLKLARSKAITKLKKE